MSKEEWKLIGHSHQIADTGDYDGCYEITNGKVSIFTKEDDDEGLQPIIDALNESGCNFYLDDSAYWVYKSDLQAKEERIKELEGDLDYFKNMSTAYETAYQGVQKESIERLQIIKDFEEVQEDHKRLCRELDEIMNGKEGMAKQASLCDLVSQVRTILTSARSLLSKEYPDGGEWLKREIEKLLGEQHKDGI